MLTRSRSRGDREKNEKHPETGNMDMVRSILGDMDEEWGNTLSPRLVYIPTYLAANRGEWVGGWVGCEGLFFASAPFTSLLI